MTASTSRWPAHPRWRGEHDVRTQLREELPGSSPLARGAQHVLASLGRRVRLIPAGAGSTVASRLDWRLKSAHPRWRGEHISPGDRLIKPVGSSPLARGAPAARRVLGKTIRLIPAGAGSTLDEYLSPGALAAHPRWRGEHQASPALAPVGSGSSPLARGALMACSPSWFRLRLIPAGAGSTSLSRKSGAGTAAHPRWRGEHFSVNVQVSAFFGSSPLARGAHSLSCGSLSR